MPSLNFFSDFFSNRLFLNRRARDLARGFRSRPCSPCARFPRDRRARFRLCSISPSPSLNAGDSEQGEEELGFGRP